MMASIAKLYLHRCDICSDKWSKHPYLGDEKAELETSVSHDHIVQRHTSRDGRWTTSSITINNPVMRDLLRASLDPHQDFDPDIEDWTFKKPFRPLVHCWDKLKHTCDHSDGTAGIKELATQLIDFLWDVLSTTLEVFSGIQKTGAVAFDEVWHIFKPGDLVLTALNGVEAVGRMKDCVLSDCRWSDTRSWAIKLEYVDWDGKRCGYTTTNLSISDFEGNRRVTSLPAYPLAFAIDSAAIKDRVTQRGRKFERLRGYHIQTHREGMVKCESTAQADSERVIIDTYAYFMPSGLAKPNLSPLNRGKDPEDSNRHDQDQHGGGWGFDHHEQECDHEIDDGGWGADPGPTSANLAAMTPEVKSAGRVEVLDELSDQECLLATPWLRGFSLKTKKWAKVCVDDLTDVVWNDAAFDNLTIPFEEKRLAWAFVRNKARKESSFDNFIEEKGRGTIILMFGPPGVGKTFTAEAIAERAHIPLYAMSAGKLGTEPEAVEASLDRALELCELWNAMFLLDEADVFLGARTDTDLARNELVAVFLTKLEYYPGVCFLTTNRMSAIDPAFQSRVDLLLRYTDLTHAARRRVWDNFIDLAGSEKFALSDEDVDALAGVEMNGREIKNLVKSALLLGADSGKVEMWVIEMLVKNRMAAMAAFEK